MKKFAFALAAVALTGAMAFAEDAAPALKLSGYLNTGLKASYIDDANKGVGLYGDDAGKEWGRFQINGSYTNGTSGVNFRLRTQGKDTLASAPTLANGYVYGWTKLFSDVVTIKVGKVDDGTFSTVGDNGVDVADGNSVLVIVSPLAGVNLGASYFADPASASSAQAYAFHAALTADKLVSFQAGFKVVESNADTLDLGLGLLAVDKLTLGADANIAGLNKYSTLGLTTLSQTVAYPVTDKVTLSAVAYEYVYGADVTKGYNSKGVADTETPFGFYVAPKVAYALDSAVTPALTLKFAQGDQGTGNAASDTKNSNKMQIFEVHPAVTFVASPSTTIIVSYAADFALNEDNVFVGDKKIAHTAIFDFRYSF